MQSLLYGTSGLNMFGSDEVRQAMLAHLTKICRIGENLGGLKLVFGSPRNRDRMNLGNAEVEDIACTYFTKLGDIASSCGVIICLEPNPTRYGANFMTTSAETAQIVKNVSHSSIRMQFDSGACTINGEDMGDILEKYQSLVGHIHLSEPDLLPLGEGNTDHLEVSSALFKRFPSQVATIEMTSGKTPLIAVEQALNVANSHYRQAEASK